MHCLSASHFYSFYFFSYTALLIDAFLFFFLMIRRPPRSTLSLHDALPIYHLADQAFVGCRWHRLRAAGLRRQRSEEHTSELQSHLNLVCRLLLEKKKTLPRHVKLTSVPRIAYRSGCVPIQPSRNGSVDSLR